MYKDSIDAFVLAVFFFLVVITIYAMMQDGSERQRDADTVTVPYE